VRQASSANGLTFKVGETVRPDDVSDPVEDRIHCH
jgi:hypothetical protein